MKKRARQSIPPFAGAADAAAALRAGKPVVVNNAAGGAAGKFAADFSAAWSDRLWLIAATPEEAEQLAADGAYWGAPALLFPPYESLPGETENPDLDIAQQRLNALRALTAAAPLLLVTTAAALLQPALPPEQLEQGKMTVAAGDEITPLTLTARLQAAGFTNVEAVELPGEYARRGGIVDVFPFFAERPVRLEFFGDVVETARYFDPATQTGEAPTDAALTVIDITRDHFADAARNTCRLTDYLTAATAVLIVAPEKVAGAAALYHSGFTAPSPLYSPPEIFARLTAQPLLIIPEFATGEIDVLLAACRDAGLPLTAPAVVTLPCAGLARIEHNLEVALAELTRLAAREIVITAVSHNLAAGKRFRELVGEKQPALSAQMQFAVGFLSAGFVCEKEKYAFVTEQEILGRVALRRPPAKRKTSPISAFTDLRGGDYVVHIAHGIALYEGVETLTHDGTTQDFLKLRFADDANLYVPLSHIELVQRYIGGGAGRPPLSKLGGGQWARRKEAAAAATKDLAQDLLRLQAARAAQPGVAMPADDTLQKEFDAAFPYEETPDQLAAINEVKADQEKATPMDRLLCGDVGFGKTEVALRAAFKAVRGGYQVAVLVPTTILAEQHFRTFRERLADYPVRVEGVSRFSETGDLRQTLADLRAGKVDIIIGTHRLLSADVEFKNLGLAVIDEEQRFGVEQKERLKKWRTSVDVLTMTATPIPRTLNLAMLKLRDISNLTTPPTERQAIRTEVTRVHDELIRRVILRELARGGQTFFLHNRVHNIQAWADKLRALVPEARFTVAHGQMDERQLYAAMSAFLARESDVLICTTIIEAGVDMPTVNTLLVNDADHFGLGQLHQLRGRVGRYKYQAYAYFLLPAQRPATPEARRRLQALEEYSELGAGFRIAMRDLEIRGAGNILGSEQSGHINVVGFELYCRLLEKSVAELRGDTERESEPVELDLGAAAYLPTDYLSSPEQRVDFYRKLNAADTDAELARAENYLRDRYGAIPAAARALFADQKLRGRARAVNVNYLGRLDDAVVVGLTAAGGNDEIAKLQFCGRKVTPLRERRWRVALLNPQENFADAAGRILTALETDARLLAAGRDEWFDAAANADAHTTDTPAGFALPVISPVEPAFSVPTAEVKRLAAGLRKQSYQAPVAAARPAAATARALSVEMELGVVSATVARDDFDPRAFGPVTLIAGGQRYFCRYTGFTGGETITLTLRSDERETLAALAAADGAIQILPGVQEDG
ncbi:MAG: transcription-repair coupling factor [Planctomycetota bacterium]|nr:transcription-repair coupling factor [Planctomycetota bacterium]